MHYIFFIYINQIFSSQARNWNYNTLKKLSKRDKNERVKSGEIRNGQDTPEIIPQVKYIETFDDLDQEEPPNFFDDTQTINFCNKRDPKVEYVVNKSEQKQENDSIYVDLELNKTSRPDPRGYYDNFDNKPEYVQILDIIRLKKQQEFYKGKYFTGLKTFKTGFPRSNSFEFQANDNFSLQDANDTNVKNFDVHLNDKGDKFNEDFNYVEDDYTSYNPVNKYISPPSEHEIINPSSEHEIISPPSEHEYIGADRLHNNKMHLFSGKTPNFTNNEKHAEVASYSDCSKKNLSKDIVSIGNDLTLQRSKTQNSIIYKDNINLDNKPRVNCNLQRSKSMYKPNLKINNFDNKPLQQNSMLQRSKSVRSKIEYKKLDSDRSASTKSINKRSDLFVGKNPNDTKFVESCYTLNSHCLKFMKTHNVSTELYEAFDKAFISLFNILGHKIEHDVEFSLFSTKLKLKVHDILLKLIEEFIKVSEYGYYTEKKKALYKLSREVFVKRHEDTKSIIRTILDLEDLDVILMDFCYILMNYAESPESLLTNIKTYYRIFFVFLEHFMGAITGGRNYKGGYEFFEFEIEKNRFARIADLNLMYCHLLYRHLTSVKNANFWEHSAHHLTKNLRTAINAEKKKISSLKTYTDQYFKHMIESVEIFKIHSDKGSK